MKKVWGVFIALSIMLVLFVSNLLFSHLAKESPSTVSKEARVVKASGQEQRAVADEPRIKVSPSSYDFGAMEGGDIIPFKEKLFSIENRGGKDLYLERLETPEGISARFLMGQVVNPQGTVEIMVTLDTRVFPPGEVNSYFAVVSNDSQEPTKKIPLRALVKKAEEGGKEVVIGPDIQFDHTTYDFGEQYRAWTVEHTFPFLNVGDEELIIERVKSPCTCTEAEATVKHLKPGDGGEIKVTFKPFLHDHDVEPRKNIRIYSNDPDEPLVTLLVLGKIKEEVRIEPEILFFRDWPRQKKAEREVKISMLPPLHQLKVNWQIKGIETTSDFVKATLLKEKEEGGGRTAQLLVSLEPGLPTGLLDEKVTIHTYNPDIDHARDFSILVRGSIVGDLKVVPERLFLMIYKGWKQEGERKVTLSWTTDKEVKVTKVTFDEPLDLFITPEAPKTLGGKKCEIPLKIWADPSTPHRGTFTGKMNIYTTHPEEKVISLPVRLSLAWAPPVS